MDGSAGLRFQVLGPLEVRGGDGLLPLGGVKPRLLLAALLVHPNAVVSSDRLSDILWGDTAPGDASTALAKYVYRLRSAFGADAGLLVTRPPGYLLSLAAGQVDAAQFAAWIADAQRLLVRSPADARTLLDDALSLWHGTPWAEFADHDFVRPEVARLEGLRATALEDRCEAMLALGAYQELIPQLELTVAEFPLRERPRALLMQALYFGGRHADALSGYRSFRRYLSDEVGLEPSAYLRGLEEEILAQKVEPGIRPRPPAAAETARPPTGRDELKLDRFVARRSELDWLEVLFGQAMPGEHPVIGLIGGPTGIGKTTLVMAFARLARARGAAVIFARCDRVLGAAGAVLETVRGARAASPEERVPPDDEMRLIDRALSPADPSAILLVLDDLDAAPEPARALLQHLVDSRYPAALCVLGTATDVGGFRVGTGRASHGRLLMGLEEDDVGDLLTLSSGSVRPDSLVQSVHEETGGVPSLVVAVGRRLRDVDAARRADRALGRADAARRGLAEVRDEVAVGVLARRELSSPTVTPVGTTADVPAPATCPYKGLAPFGAADADFFFGRERLVADLVARLAVDGFLGVVGASGSGKSSLVAAGLVPALAAGGLPGSDHWPSLIIRPGRDPIGALSAGLSSFTDEPAIELRRRLATDSTELLAIAGHLTHTDGRPPKRLILIVDQFEEAFSATIGEDARGRFIDALMLASADRDSQVVVAVVLRADYYGSCAQHEGLARSLGQSQVLVAAMNEADLRRAVVEPARRAGLDIEDGLAEAICRDAAGEPGALPLVSTALLETWVRRSGDTLTIAGYREAGGVRGALARLADSVYDHADEPGRTIMRRIFRRLADPEGATDDVRRRARRDELATTEAEHAVLAELISRRLVTATEDTVEVAHEALLREWPRLRGWLQDDRDGRRLHRQLGDAATAWDTEGRDEAGLYRGVRLQAARDWTASHPGDANPLERAFLDAADAAQQRTLHAARRTARRLRTLAAALATLLILALTAAALAATQRSAARHQALQADISRLATLARTLPNDQRDLALLLGAQGYQLQPSDVSVGGLQAALVQTPPGLERVIRYRSATFGPHLDRSGRLLAVPGADGTVTIIDVATGRVVRTLTYPRPREFAVFSGDANLVAAGGFDGTIAVWDLRTGKLSGPPLQVAVGSNSAWPMFDPTDNDRLYVVTNLSVLTTWDRHDPAHPRQIRPPYEFGGNPGNRPPDRDPSAITISPDGQLVAVGDPSVGVVSVLDARTGALIRLLVGAPGAFGADGLTLPIGSAYQVTLYNAVTGQPEATLNSPGGWLHGRLSGDGRRIAVTQGVNIAVYDVRSGKAIGEPLRLHANGAFPVGFLPDGQLVTSGNHEAGIWTIGRALPPIGRSLPAPGDYDWPVFLPGEREIVTRGRDHGTLQRHDVATGAALGTLLGGRIGPDFAASPKGDLLVAPAKDGSGTAIWRSGTGDRLGVLTNVPDDAALAWSPTARVVAAASGSVVQLWDVTDPTHPVRTAVLTGVPGLSPTHVLTFSRDGTLLENSGVGTRIAQSEQNDNGITVIDVNRRRILWSTTLTDALSQTVFSPDGKTLAVDSGDASKGLVTLYNARTGQPGATIAPQTNGGIGYLHGGQWLVATGGDTQPGAQLYDTQTQQPIGVPFPIKHIPGDDNDGIGFPIAVNNAGTLFAAGEPNAPVLWDVDPNHLRTIACTIAGRNLRHAEWNTYLPNRSYQRTCPQWPAGE